MIDNQRKLVWAVAERFSLSPLVVEEWPISLLMEASKWLEITAKKNTR